MPPLQLPRRMIPDHLPQFHDLLASLPHLSRRDLTPQGLHFPDLSVTSPLATRTSRPAKAGSNPFRTLSSLVRRQTVVAIPATYSGLDAGPPAGNIVGIVLGSVAGFLLLLWLFYTCSNMGGRGDVVAEQTVQRRARSPRRSSRARSDRSRSEMMESRRSRSPPPPRRERERETRRETIVVEERRAPPPVVIEREDDIVEVIEEHSPPRRVRSSRDRNSGGYRPVDPDLYAGGNRPMRKVSRR